jgi:hypothetical protein
MYDIESIDFILPDVKTVFAVEKDGIRIGLFDDLLLAYQNARGMLFTRKASAEYEQVKTEMADTAKISHTVCIGTDREGKLVVISRAYKSV